MSTSAAKVSFAASAFVLSGFLAGCNSPDVSEAMPEGAEEEDTIQPSSDPSHPNPHDAEDVDVSRDVAMRAVATAADAEGGTAVGFLKEKEDTDETGMFVQLLGDNGGLVEVHTAPEGTSTLDTNDDGDADEELSDLADRAEVPLLRAMEIAQGESPGPVQNAQLEPRETEDGDDRVVWVVVTQGPADENTVVIDAESSAVVPEGDNPLEENNIGGDPDTAPEE